MDLPVLDLDPDQEQHHNLLRLHLHQILEGIPDLDQVDGRISYHSAIRSARVQAMVHPPEQVVMRPALTVIEPEGRAMEIVSKMQVIFREDGMQSINLVTFAASFSCIR